jgi:hypothetical protein
MTSTQQRTFDPYNLSGRDPFLTYGSVWKDPNKAAKRRYESKLKRPNPPTPEAIKRAQFVDKTYKWTGK